MAKYDALARYLSSVPSEQTRVEMRLADIDRLVRGLPASAWKYRPWWGNSSHVQARAWRAAGWHVQGVDMRRSRVVFARGQVGGTYAARRALSLLVSGAGRGGGEPDGADDDGALVEADADMTRSSIRWPTGRRGCRSRMRSD